MASSLMNSIYKPYGSNSTGNHKLSVTKAHVKLYYVACSVNYGVSRVSEEADYEPTDVEKLQRHLSPLKGEKRVEAGAHVHTEESLF